MRGFNVKVGDYPERDLFDSDDDDDCNGPTCCNQIDKSEEDGDDDEF